MLHAVCVQDRQCLRVKVRVLAHSLFNARCGCPHQHQHFDMCHDFRCQRLIGDFFVIAARNQDDLLVKAAQARNGAGGAGCDGVIVIRYAIQHANRLNAVFHAGKGRANLTHDIHRNAAPDRCNGGQQIFHVVQAAQLYFCTGQHGGHNTVFGIAEGIITLSQECTVVGLVQAGEPELFTFAVSGHAPGDIILITQYGAAGWLLPKQNVAFGINILLHILVVVQVVGGHVGHNRHLGTLAHADQLEAGKFHNSDISRGNVRQLGQQGCANVAAQEHLAAGSLKHLGNQGGGGGFAVRAGHSHDLAGAQLKKEFYLAGHKRTGLFGGLQLRLKEFIAGGAHDDILSGKAIGIMLAKAELYVQLAQRIGVITKIIQALFLVAEGDICPQRGKHGDARFVADARTDECHLFASDHCFKLFHGSHNGKTS